MLSKLCVLGVLMCLVCVMNACNSDEFTCKDEMSNCIVDFYECDGEPDCLNGLDEANCPENDEEKRQLNDSKYI
ncbi:low-density lipoprotein receptor [Biomphalaria glabrata]|nr:low-density lipoprotein receptor-like [Biomphalaria glabrata]KAI8774170.1 low-density lipoprotein receptor [Biomphalaria glabrata]